jgi:hypothetical protein
MTFDKITVDNMRNELNDVLKRYGSHVGVKFEIGRITYDNDSFRTSIKAFNTADGVDSKKVEFAKNCRKFGIPQDWYGKNIIVDGVEHRIIGVRPRARKYPILLKNLATGNETLCIPEDYARKLVASYIPYAPSPTPTPIEFS